MNIETLLVNLTEALNNNTAAINAVLAQSAVTPLPGNPMPVETPAKKAKAKLEVVTAPREIAREQDVPTPEPEPEPEQPETPFNRDELIATITATVKENYRKAGSQIGEAKAKFEALRAEFGCKSVTELSDEKLVEFWPRLQAIS